ncbi:MAG TPA: hypothetical protein PK876_03845 [Elusimicrobiota bacterium]|nr:hypothetical protein [Elusimicrobiota bacterium]
MHPWLQKRGVQNALLILGTAAIAYAMVYVDVMARAREAFRQGERYTRWHENIDDKKRFYEEKFLREKGKLEKKKEQNKISQEDYEQDLEILQFDREQALNDSSIKYAYQWYKDTYELFSPPESRWVREARFLAPAAKERWRDELRSKNIPFEEYMLDLEAGETADTLMVTSTQSRRKASRWTEILRSTGIPCNLYDAEANGRLAQEGLKLIVPRDQFWRAHEVLSQEPK